MTIRSFGDVNPHSSTTMQTAAPPPPPPAAGGFGSATFGAASAAAPAFAQAQAQQHHGPDGSAPGTFGSFGSSASTLAPPTFSFGAPSIPPATAAVLSPFKIGATSSASGTGLFGGTPSTASNLFGAAPSTDTSLLGSVKPSTTPVFGVSSTPSSAGLFGTPSTTGTGSVFGSSNVFGSASSTTAAPAPSVFGAGAATATSTHFSGGSFGGGAFAGGQTRPSGFGVPELPPPSSFGNPFTNKSMFDLPAPPGPSTPGKIFGATSGSGLFGGKPAFGSATGVSSKAAPSCGLFGGVPPPSIAPLGGSLFGAPAPVSSAFGRFGSATPASNLFGGFGANSGTLTAQTMDPFGSPAGVNLNSILNDDDSLGFGSGGVRGGSDRSSYARSSALYLNSAEARQKTAQTVQSQFKPVDLTKEMTETYYYGRQDSDKDLGASDVNSFWLDYAEWDESLGGSFLSQVPL